jgi:hypothetical protein
MLAPLTTTPTAVWPVTGDASDLQQVVWAQAATMMEQNDLIQRYQTILENAQAVPPATATGNSTGTTTLTLTGVVGVIAIGAVITGTNIPAGTTIVALGTGTGGNGTYITSVATTVSNTALTFTPGGGNSPWPPQTDAPDLLDISTRQTTILRSQNALINQYVDLLNVSSTTPPP